MTRNTKRHLAGVLLASIVLTTLPFTATIRRLPLEYLTLLVLLACTLVHLVTHWYRGASRKPSRQGAPRAIGAAGARIAHALERMGTRSDDQRLHRDRGPGRQARS